MRMICLLVLVISLISTSPPVYGARPEKKVADEGVVTDSPESSVPAGVNVDLDDEPPGVSYDIESEEGHQIRLSHQGIVLSVKNNGGYSFIKFSENGTEAWMATAESDVKAGDLIEFPDSPPYKNYYYKPLRMKFKNIMFAPGLNKLRGPNKAN